MAAYLDRPLFPENFSAEEAYDDWCGRSLDNWNTFYEGGTRLISYLQHVGLQRFDAGRAGRRQHDLSQRPGGAHAALRYGGIFHLRPRPRAQGRAGNVAADVRPRGHATYSLAGIRRAVARVGSRPPRRRAARPTPWIGSAPTACPTAPSHPAQRGLAPYYNVLNPRVQKAMLAVLEEVVERYARHPSFSGIAIRLSADGYAQLPGPDWGLDDQTIAAFQRDSQAFRARRRPGSLCPASRLSGPGTQSPLVDRVAGGSVERILLESAKNIACGAIGQPLVPGRRRDNRRRRKPVRIEARLVAPYHNGRLVFECGHRRQRISKPNRQLVFLRPERLVAGGNLAAKAAELEIGQMPDIERYFQGLPVAGSLFFHVPREIHIPSFDQKSPIKPSYAGLVSQPSPSGPQNRRRFVHDLAALDTQAMFDGGWLLPMGQEDAIRDLVAAYRSLPAVPIPAGRSINNRRRSR